MIPFWLRKSFPRRLTSRMRTPFLLGSILLAPLPLFAQGTTLAPHSHSSVAVPAKSVSIVDSTTMVPCPPVLPAKKPVVHKHHHHVVHKAVPATPVVPGVTPAVVHHVIHHKKHHKPAAAPKSRTVPQKMCPSVRTLAMNTPSSAVSAIVPEWTKALGPVTSPDVSPPVALPNLTSPAVNMPQLVEASSGHKMFALAAVPAIFLMFLHHGNGGGEEVQTTFPPGGPPPPPGIPATVPEPGTWVLLGTGLLLLGFVALRRRRSARQS